MEDAQDLSFLVEESENVVAPDNVLARIAAKAEEYKASRQRLADLEEAMKDEKKLFNKISQEDLPTLLRANGLESVTLQTGEKVSVKEDLSASIKDAEKLAKFLEERGDDALIKTTMEFGKVPAEILEHMRRTLADNYGLYPDIKQTVHSQTLAKYFRNLCGIGGEHEAEFPLAQIDPKMVTVFTFFKTTIK